MRQNVDSEGTSTSVAPLRMRQADGSLYRRPQEIEHALAVLSSLPASELLERCRIDEPDDPGYVPSECLLYFVRRPCFGSEEDTFRELFLLLRQRVLGAVRVSVRRVAGSAKLAEQATDLDVRDAALHKFQEMLCGDRREYDQRLDFYEIRFNQALAMLRKTARRKVVRRESRTEPMDGGDTNEPSGDVEQALAAMKNRPDGEGIDFLYRSKLHAAITSLPPDEKRVVELILRELPIDSQDKDVLTIVKVLGCSEKTVRNRRDRAFEKLRDALKDEEDG